jgi:hypothetical protein
MNVNRFYALAAVWGLVDAVVAITFVGKARTGGSTAVGALVELVAVAIVFLAGRQAKIGGGRPWRVGATAGILFGLFSGWSGFLIRITRHEIMLATHSLTSSQISVGLKMANSTAGHVETWAVAVIEGLVLGIILGWVGGMTGRSPGQMRDV